MKNENDVKTYEEQQTETIRERKIAVKLSDEDCDRLARLCGTHGLTIGELIENLSAIFAEHIVMVLMKECVRNSGSIVVGLECFQNLHF